MKILVIGSGSYVIGHNHSEYGTIFPSIIKYYKEVNNNIELTIFAKSKKRLNNFKLKIKFFEFNMRKFSFFTPEDINFDNLLKDNIFDMAIVCVPDHVHFFYLKKIIKKKIHTLVVKPFVLKSSEAKYLIELEKQNKLICRVEQHKRYDPSNLYLKQQFELNKLGNINHVLVQYSQSKIMSKFIFKSWFNNTNIINYLGIHYLDLILFITGFNPNLISNLKLKDQKNNYIGNVTNIKWINNESKKKDYFIQTLVLNLNEPSNTPVPSRQKINILFQKGRIDIDQDHRGISSLEESGKLEYINPQFSKIFTNKKNKIIYGYGIDSVFNFLLKIHNMKNSDNKYCLDLNPSFKEAGRLIKILEDSK